MLSSHRRMIGSGRDNNAVGDINAFRTREVLDEDNKYRREVLDLTKKKLQAMSVNPDIIRPTANMTDQEKYLLNVHINRFLNEIDSEVESYYNNVDATNSGTLISIWNSLCLYYKSNVSKTYKPYLDSQIQGDPIDKLRIISQLAIDSDYTDKKEVLQLYNYASSANYEPIRIILYSSQLDANRDFTPYEQTLLPTTNPLYKPVLRRRKVPLGRPPANVQAISMAPPTPPPQPPQAQPKLKFKPAPKA